jgi:uncharacterized protein (TIGR00251 family)
MTPPASAPTGTGWPCLSVHEGVVWLAVSVSPNARRTQAEGLHDGALRVRLAAPPVDGKANDLLLAWLAGELDLPRRAVRLVRGESARRKWLAVDAPLERLAQWLQELVDRARAA